MEEKNLFKLFVNYYISDCFEQEEINFISPFDNISFKQQFHSFLLSVIQEQYQTVKPELAVKFKDILLSRISSYTSDVTTAVTIIRELDAFVDNRIQDTKISYLIQQLPQLCWIINSSKESLEFNLNWTEYTGFEVTNTDDWLSVIHEDDRTEFDTIWTDKHSLKEIFGFEYRLRDTEGEYRWFSLKCVPIINQRGELYWIGINTDVNELIDASEKIESINHDLDNFIYIASHDLKAPISNLEGLLHIIEDLLGKKLQEDEILRSVLHMINESIVKLQATIKDLAHVSKIQRNLSEDIEEVKFSEIIDDVAIEIKSEITEANAIISTELETAPVVRFSKQDMKSVISNLISNALKYKSPERKPEVTISSMRKNGQIILMVRDNGLGIPEDKKEYIFKMFKRLHDHVDGSGIGLYIVKRIIDNNQGTIEVESKVGKGTVFKVYFPEE